MPRFDLPAFLAVLAIVVAIFLFFVKDVKDDLKEADSRDYFKARLRESNYTNLYWSAVQRAVRLADQCLTSAAIIPPAVLLFAFGFCYSAYFFFYSWCFGGPSTIGSVELLPQTPKVYRYAAAVLFTITAVGYPYVVLSFWRRAYKIEEVRAGLVAALGSLPDRNALPLPPLFVVLAVMLVFHGASGLSLSIYSVKDSPWLALGFAVYAMLVVTISGFVAALPFRTPPQAQLAKLSAVAFAVYFLLEIIAFPMIFYVSDTHLPYLAAIIYLAGMLPAACTVSNLISWSFARLLAKRLTKAVGPWALAAQITLTAVGAFLCVHLAAAAVVISVGLLNRIFALQRKAVPLDLLLPDVPSAPIVSGATATWLLGPLLMAAAPFLLHLIALAAGGLTLTTPHRVRAVLLERLEGNPAAARLTLPALYFAGLPWMALLLVIASFGAVLALLDASLPTVLTSLLTTARRAQEVVTLHPYAASGLFFGGMALLMLSFRSRENDRATPPAGPTSPPQTTSVTAGKGLAPVRKPHRKRRSRK